MKKLKLFFLSGLLLTSTSFAAQLHTFTDISNAIGNGKQLRIVTDFAKCTAPDKMAVTAANLMSLAAFSPNEIGATDSYIATALTHFTMNDPYFPGKPVYEFVRYTINPDNTMNVIMQVLDAPTYAVIKDKVTFTCTIDSSTQIYG